MKRTTKTMLSALAMASAGTTALSAPAAAAPDGVVADEVLVRFEGREGERVVELPAGVTVTDAVAALDANPHIAYAAPNHIATASGSGSKASFVPKDPGTANTAGGWQQLQWNFLPCGSTCGQQPAAPGLESFGGINAPGAWQNLIDAKHPGGSGVTVAVVDTGVAYRDLGKRFERSPDFKSRQFVPGHDFVERDDIALDENGHGTHVAGTIGEQTNNKRAVTGLAYGAQIMPVRVLNAKGEGTARNVAKGIRWAAKHGADVINLSIEFCISSCAPSGRVTRCEDVPGVCEAVAAAQSSGAIVIGSAGNEGGSTQVAFPARHAVAVGGTTEHGCLAEYSNYGDGLDLVAPGGGADGAGSAAPCVPLASGRTIAQLTLKGKGFDDFGYPSYEGNSMASAHASGVAALVWAQLEHQLGRDPTPAEVEARMESTTRHSGILGDTARYGAGLLDAAAATEP